MESEKHTYIVCIIIFGLLNKLPGIMEPVQGRLAEIRQLVDQIRAQLDDLLSERRQKSLDHSDESCNPLSTAKLQVTLAYAMNTLYLCTGSKILTL